MEKITRANQCPRHGLLVAHVAGDGLHLQAGDVGAHSGGAHQHLDLETARQGGACHGGADES